MNKGIVAVAVSLLLVGCAAQTPEYRLGQFTAASSFNVRNLDYDSTSATRVEGEDCHQVGQQPNDSRLQRAMDQAIQNGQEQGITGDLLVNVRIDQVQKNKPGNFFGLPVAHNCIQVEGELVTLR
ncbi:MULTISPECIES: hypothetical protein [unclassified Marinobacter]|uniref:hypothetical protein n=1 Tax=unclassified Marinobacter TaxID=83889 RepID=UPI000BF989F8|nr:MULTISPECIES: hypothetical protein [unclassified Marinobacter]PFG10749.1 hypothetical protein ATI45_3228 [Marinobacter sp. LV10MA510-1]PFG52640.1 hypothetical protein ATG98_1691 [Marinobacter sp. LV10R520-4]